MYDLVFSFFNLNVNAHEVVAAYPCLINCAKFMFDPNLNFPLPAELQVPDGVELIRRIVPDLTRFIWNDTIPLDMEAEEEMGRVRQVFEYWSQIDIAEEARQYAQQLERPRLTDRWLTAIDLKHRLTAFKLYIINPTASVWDAIGVALRADVLVRRGYEIGTDRLVEMIGVNMTFVDFDWAFNNSIRHDHLDTLDPMFPGFLESRHDIFTGITQEAATPL